MGTDKDTKPGYPKKNRATQHPVLHSPPPLRWRSLQRSPSTSPRATSETNFPAIFIQPDERVDKDLLLSELRRELDCVDQLFRFPK